jgi:3-oxoadipate enol-lactonase
MPRAKVNNVEIAYSTHGAGEPLVLIGGFTMARDGWAIQVAGLEKHFRVITLDNRGAGESTAPSEPFTVADMAADTIGLLDALAIDAAHFFGVSMGGLITQVVALDYPGRVKKIALGCTSHGGMHAIQPEKEVMAALAESANPDIPMEESIRKKVQFLFSQAFIKNEPKRIEQFVRFSIKSFPTQKGAAGQMGALSVFNSKKRLGEIRCPVLVITGSADRMMPPENSRLLAEGIPGAELYMVEGAGHSFFLERPEEVNRALIDFFTRHNA